MNNAEYGKTMKILRHRIDVRLSEQQKGLLEMDIKAKPHVIKNTLQ